MREGESKKGSGKSKDTGPKQTAAEIRYKELTDFKAAQAAEFEDLRYEIEEAPEGETAKAKTAREASNRRARDYNADMKNRHRKGLTQFEFKQNKGHTSILAGQRTESAARRKKVGENKAKGKDDIWNKQTTTGPQTKENAKAWKDYDKEIKVYDRNTAMYEKAEGDVWKDARRKYPDLKDTGRIPDGKGGTKIFNAADEIIADRPIAPEPPKELRPGKGKARYANKVPAKATAKQRNTKANNQAHYAYNQAKKTNLEIDARNVANKDVKGWIPEKHIYAAKPALDAPDKGWTFENPNKTTAQKSKTFADKLNTKASTSIKNIIPGSVKDAGKRFADIVKPFAPVAKSIARVGGPLAAAIGPVIDTADTLNADINENFNLKGPKATLDNAGLGWNGMGWGKVDDSLWPTMNIADLTETGDQRMQGLVQSALNSTIFSDDDPWIRPEEMVNAVSQMDDRYTSGFLKAPKKLQNEYIQSLKGSFFSGSRDKGKTANLLKQIAGYGPSAQDRENLDYIIKNRAGIEGITDAQLKRKYPKQYETTTKLQGFNPEASESIKKQMRSAYYKDVVEPYQGGAGQEVEETFSSTQSAPFSSEPVAPVIESGAPVPPQAQTTPTAPAPPGKAVEPETQLVPQEAPIGNPGAVSPVEYAAMKERAAGIKEKFNTDVIARATPQQLEYMEYLKEQKETPQLRQQKNALWGQMIQNYRTPPEEAAAPAPRVAPTPPPGPATGPAVGPTSAGAPAPAPAPGGARFTPPPSLYDQYRQGINAPAPQMSGMNAPIVPPGSMPVSTGPTAPPGPPAGNPVGSPAPGPRETAIAAQAQQIRQQELAKEAFYQKQMNNPFNPFGSGSGYEDLQARNAYYGAR